MTVGNSREITTNQNGVHEKLDALVAKYKNSVSQRPIGAHTQAAFDEACEWLGTESSEVILDSCCGVGESTANLAKANQNCRVIGLDKSELRVEKHAHYSAGQDNYLVIRADVNDFWRLVRQSNWQIKQHCLFYPNPYPKKTQVQKRWHASAAMPDLMAICKNLEVRSNWQIYIEEFARAAESYGVSGQVEPVDTTDPMTPFERKYSASGQACWRVHLT